MIAYLCWELVIIWKQNCDKNASYLFFILDKQNLICMYLNKWYLQYGHNENIYIITSLGPYFLLLTVHYTWRQWVFVRRSRKECEICRYAWKVAGTHIIVYVYLFVCVCVDNPSRFCNHQLHFNRQQTMFCCNVYWFK